MNFHQNLIICLIKLSFRFFVFEKVIYSSFLWLIFVHHSLFRFCVYGLRLQPYGLAAFACNNSVSHIGKNLLNMRKHSMPFHYLFSLIHTLFTFLHYLFFFLMQSIKKSPLFGAIFNPSGINIFSKPFYLQFLYRIELF